MACEAQVDLPPHSTRVERVVKVRMFESILGRSQDVLRIRFLFSSSHVQEFCRHGSFHQEANRLRFLSKLYIESNTCNVKRLLSVTKD